MKLTQLFRLIFLVVLLGSALTGCLPATSETMDFSANDVHALSLSLQANPTGNISAQFHVVPNAVNTVTIKVVCVNNNAFPVTLTIQDEIVLSVYNQSGELVEVAKNQYTNGKGSYKMELEPGQEIQVDSFNVTKPHGEQSLAFSEFSYSLNGEAATKVQSVTSVF